LACSYAHRDVKSENIMVRAASGNRRLITDVRLTEFGIVCRLDDKQSLMEICGTPGFIAPEVLMRQVEDGRKVDVWSLACVILERSVDADWFEDNWMSPNNAQSNYQDAMSMKDLSPLHDAVANTLAFLASKNDSVFDFMRQTLVLDPKLRPTFEALALEQRIPSSSSSRHRLEISNVRSLSISVPELESVTSSPPFPSWREGSNSRQASDMETHSTLSMTPPRLNVPGISSLPRALLALPQTPLSTLSPCVRCSSEESFYRSKNICPF